jgi:hypothetical protein
MHPASFLIAPDALENHVGNEPWPLGRVVSIDGSAIRCWPFAFLQKLEILPLIGISRRLLLQVDASDFAARDFLEDPLNDWPSHRALGNDERRGPVSQHQSSIRLLRRCDRVLRRHAGLPPEILLATKGRLLGLRAPTNEIAHRVDSSLKIGIGLLARSLPAGGQALPRMTCCLGSRDLIVFTLTA